MAPKFILTKTLINLTFLQYTIDLVAKSCQVENIIIE